MKVLELFSGTESFSKVCRERGHDCRTLENDPKFSPTYLMNILDFKPEILGDWRPDVIWSSPPCQKFSVATLGKNWSPMDDTLVPKTEDAKKSIELVKRTIAIIKELQPKVFFIENPVGALRKMYFMKLIPRKTVTYCQYGDKRQKKTDIWTNCVTWRPKPVCSPRDPCHERSPRGSRKGTQGLKDATERGQIPKDLCLDLCSSCEKQVVSCFETL